MWNILGDGPINTSHASSTAPNLRLVEVLDDGVLAWQERALCAQTDPEAFFPEKGRLHPWAEARLRFLRGPRRVPRGTPGQRRALRHLGWPVRA